LISGLVVSVDTWLRLGWAGRTRSGQNQVIALLAGGDLGGCPGDPGGAAPTETADEPGRDLLRPGTRSCSPVSRPPDN